MIDKSIIRALGIRTTRQDETAPCPQDRVKRLFQAEKPNKLWVADFTYISTWMGFIFVVFIIDVFARKIVGWRVASTANADFVKDALDQALCERQPAKSDGLVHHSDRGVQYASIKYTQCKIYATHD